VVAGEPSSRRRLVGALAEFAPVDVAGADAALALLARQQIDLVLCEYQLPEGTGLELLRACQAQHPAMRRLLIASYADLPSIVRARGSGVVERVIQKATRAEAVRRIVAESLGCAPPPRVQGGSHVAPQEMEALLRWTAERVAQVPGVVIRQMPPEGAALRLEFVLPGGADCDVFRREVVTRWLWPVKPRGGPALPEDAGHPVLEHLGEMQDAHEVYARRIGDEGLYAYLALFPWRNEERVTAAFGLYRPSSVELLRPLLVSLHHVAVEEVAELHLPILPPENEATGPGDSVLEYDWVVTKSYVGPDRRSQPTPFWSRFTLVGRRRYVPSRVARTADTFVDRLLPWARWYAAGYLLLSAIDTGLTWWCVRHGIVKELNPLLRPLLHERPWLFLAWKNLFTVLVFVVAARFQRFRIGRYLLATPVAAFAILDLYWLLALYA
jgi:CheY-like chemotaxis protein